MKIYEANACYTGGGIYILYGKTEEGYFLTSNDWESALILDKSAEDFDESLYENWQNDHLIREVFGEEAEALYADAVEWIKKVMPDGNYDPEEL